MNEPKVRAAITLAGVRVEFWSFLGSILAAYLAAVVVMWVGGPLGMFAAMLIGPVTTVIMFYGLFLFAIQRPVVGFIVLGSLFAIHLGLLEARVPSGLFWPFWSKPGLHWMTAHSL